MQDPVGRRYTLLRPLRQLQERQPGQHRAYLYQCNAVAYACAFAGLRLTDRRAVAGPPDVWVELPRRDYWSH